MKHLLFIPIASLLIALAPIHSCISQIHGATSSSPDSLFSLMQIPATGQSPFHLCDQKLTSANELQLAVNYQEGAIICDEKSLDDVFFVKDADIPSTPISRVIELRYNCAAVYNHVLHSCELYFQLADGDDPLDSRKNSPDCFKSHLPKMTNAILERHITSPAYLTKAKRFVSAYSRSGGLEDVIDKAIENYLDVVHDIPQFITMDEIDSFEDGFWEWYDKAQFVPEIDSLVAIHLAKKVEREVSNEEFQHLKKVILAEKNIDRRTILALEYVKNRPYLDGVELLGDIIESGIYTRYLLEAWVSYRTHLQAEIGISSFSYIANHHYDCLRVKCLNTMLRHYEETKDINTLVLIENLISSEIIHRVGGLYGNEAFILCETLENQAFIHPRMIDDK